MRRAFLGSPEKWILSLVEEEVLRPSFPLQGLCPLAACCGAVQPAKLWPGSRALRNPE